MYRQNVSINVLLKYPQEFPNRSPQTHHSNILQQLFGLAFYASSYLLLTKPDDCNRKKPEKQIKKAEKGCLLRGVQRK